MNIPESKPNQENEPTIPVTQISRDWRESEGHQLILFYFISPNTIDNLPKSYEWDAVLGESLNSACDRLVVDGALRVEENAKWRIMHGRGAVELKDLCRTYQLKVSGTKEQLAERLAGIDPSGELLGCKKRLLICSDDAARFITLHRESLNAAMGDLRELWGLFTFSQFEAEKDSLTNRFSAKGYGRPSNDDVKWSIMNKKALQHAQEGNLGLCRNMYHAMASFLDRRGKLKQALPLYLLVCAYDLNGAMNRGGISTELLRQFPLFDSKFSFLAPGVVGEVVSIINALSMTKEELSEIFTEVAAKGSFPLPAERIWPVLILALEGNLDLNQQPNCFEEIRKLVSKVNEK
jgi:hypothetical protein